MKNSCSGLVSNPVSYAEGTVLLIPLTSGAGGPVVIWMWTGMYFHSVGLATDSGMTQAELLSYEDILNS